jgi:predicted DNA-binding WGR domain protein
MVLGKEKETQLAMQDWRNNVDKVYNLRLIKHHNGAGFEVISTYGRKHGHQTVHKKTDGPVNYSQANEIYHNLLHEKVKKGYEIAYQHESEG